MISVLLRTGLGLLLAFTAAGALAHKASDSYLTLALADSGRFPATGTSRSAIWRKRSGWTPTATAT